MLQISSNGVGPTSKQNIQRHACGIQLSKHVQKSRKALASNQLWHGVVFVARSSIRHSCLSFLEQPFRLSSDTVFLEVSVCIQLRWENLIIMPDLSRIGTFCFTRKGAALQVSSRDLYYISFWGMFGEDPQLTHQKLKVTRQARQATVTRFRSHAGHVPSRKSCAHGVQRFRGLRSHWSVLCPGAGGSRLDSAENMWGKLHGHGGTPLSLVGF